MESSSGLDSLRRAAVEHTLFPPVDLAAAFDRLGFVQADPIRAPARAQDLILRHRVVDFRAGDLERAYPALPLVEDMVHVYGFLHRRYRALLHPRRVARVFRVEQEHPSLRRAILDHLKAHGPSHPRTIERALASRHPRTALINAWGGQSNATTGMLDVLHYRGLLHVTRRERGIRVYALASPAVDADAGRIAALSPQKRADGLIALLTDVYAPLPMASLRQLTAMLGERAIAREAVRARIPALIKRGVLCVERVDGVDYVRPAARRAPEPRAEVGPTVRFLAPFDPLVWDRRRFEHLWGWRYRFEAYTPAARRSLGYYALPLLWDTERDARVIGWVNVARRAGQPLAVDAGYATRRPAGTSFRSAFDAEVARLEAFLARDEASDEATGGASDEVTDGTSDGIDAVVGDDVGAVGP